MIRVLIVDDSDIERQLLAGILSVDPDITVIGTASDGKQAIKKVAELRPDIVTMDINMPGMDGFFTTRQIMEHTPVPIIIVSGIDSLSDISSSFKAVQAGALYVLKKPPGPMDPFFAKSARELRSVVKTYAEVKVVRRRKMSTPEIRPDGDEQIPIPRGSEPVRLVAIGASTGGPPVIQQIIAGLPRDLSVPVMIVQHIAAGFTEGFADWLAESTGKPVTIGENFEFMKSGHFYIAPEGVQMGIGPELAIRLSHAPPEHHIIPSVSYLFRSVSEVLGAGAIPVLLTGMGEDGAEEVVLLHTLGASTIVQDEKSSIIFGMPGKVVKLGGADFILPPDQIPRKIVELLHAPEMRS